MYSNTKTDSLSKEIAHTHHFLETVPKMCAPPCNTMLQAYWKVSHDSPYSAWRIAKDSNCLMLNVGFQLFSSVKRYADTFSLRYPQK